MYLIIIGCEYVGKTTLLTNLRSWLEANMGQRWLGRYSKHDHFVLPFNDHELHESADEAKQEADYVRGMPPWLLEKYSRYLIDYHFRFFKGDHNLLTNWYYGDAVYAPLYYGYGAEGQFNDRRAYARLMDADVMAAAPNTILALLKASPETIRRRKRENPHPNCFVKDEDIELILQRFQEEHERSLIRCKISLDTTDSTPEATFQEFLRRAESKFTDSDRLKILAHREIIKPQSE